MVQLVRSLPARWGTQVQSLVGEDLWEKEMANPLQYSCLENPMDRGVTKSWTWMSD